MDSTHLIAANVANVMFGFLFWTSAARLYQPQYVGLAAAVVASVGLMAMLATLGLDYALVRYLPHMPDEWAVIDSSLTIGLGASLVASTIFLGGVDFWLPALLPFRTNGIFVSSVVLATMLTVNMGLLNATFLVKKRAGFIFGQSLVFGAIRCAAVLAFVFTTAHSLGVLESWALGLLAAGVFGIGIALPQVAGKSWFRFTVTCQAVKGMASFAFANYASAVLWNAPMFILPILIANMAGSEAIAYFYVANSVSGLLAMIPTAASLSLLAHGSQDESELIRRTRESAGFALLLLIPAIAGVFLLGEKILMLFGSAYAEHGTRLLWILAFTTLPLTVNSLFFSIRRIERRMLGVIAASGWILLLTLTLSAALLPRVGLLGPGIAWFLAQSSLAVVIVARYAFTQ